MYLTFLEQHFNPPTPEKKKKFAEFRDTFTEYACWPQEFKSARIFLSRLLFLKYEIFNSVRLFAE